MIKPFAALAFSLLVMLLMMFSHYLFYPVEQSIKNIQMITSLTHMAPLSLSVSYDESQYNSTYPEMHGLGRMDFIYEQ